ncbi:unnamed protein product [Bursaphelenchus xylophilus]|uniref:(pine wood nematode) hypothetical protein n=1 Tax=Bursaphelenchus xylophilus TaxID=6326 RepID=A0A1I7S2L6_BURXY|nr:unnamed protein product [Bursaphelenchus xylophilus]CAG9121853.1 unnamed protein product [Bursaphelenchus xylophilus]
MKLVLVTFVVVLTVAHVVGKPQLPPPGDFPPMPPELERILPADAVSKLKSIHTDRSLGFLEKQQKIDEVMSSLPAEILDKIPPPPGFNKLPENVQQQLKSINRSRELSWQQKQEKLRELIHSLPAHLRSILMPPMPGGR